MVNILSQQNSVISQFISEIRDIEIQNDRMRFRRNMERMGEVAAYEISKKLEWTEKQVTTPLGIASSFVLKEQPVLATILRAGLSMHQGMLNYFDQAENAFISAYRRHHKDGSFDIHLEYVSSPAIENRILIICDPMLATGQSMVKTIKALYEKGKPKHIHIVAAIASTQGVEYIKSHLPNDLTLWIGAVDDELTAQAYIVPGLGDAGDLAFGIKS